MVQLTEGDSAQIVCSQEVNESGGVATLSWRLAKEVVMQGCAVRTDKRIPNKLKNDKRKEEDAIGH